MTLEHATHCHGDGARLLGDNDHHRIAGLAGAHTGPVPGAQVGAEPMAVGQGHDAAGGGDAAVPDDHGTVMEGRLGEKDVADELLGNPAVDDGAGFEIFVQLVGPGEDDQRAHPLPAHDLTGLDGLADDHVHLAQLSFGSQEPAQADGAAQVVHHPPQLRLEQDHHRHQSHGQDLAQDKVQGSEFQDLGQGRHGQNGHDAPEDAHGGGGPHQQHHPIDQKGHQKDIDHVTQVHAHNGLELLPNGFHHLIPSLLILNLGRCRKSRIRTLLSNTL